ncbi:MAG: FeoA family protein [Oscillospiraceae bacterium]
MDITADKLKINTAATVKALSCEGELRRRIIDMGITPGATIKLRKKAPFGDPLEFHVRGYELSIRKSEAQKIMVEVVKGGTK